MKNNGVLMLALAAALAGGGSGCTGNSPSTAKNILPVPDNIPTKPDAPLTANTHFAAGQVAESQEDFPRAIVQYEAAVKLDSTASVPLLRIGMIYTNQRQFDKAVDAWNRYIKVTNGSAAGYCDLGYTLEMAQRFSDAEAAYKTAIAKEPKNEPARVNYGLMLARQGRNDEAIKQLQQVLSPAEVHYNLASVYESQGDRQDAKVQYQQALRLDPDMSDAKVRLAAIETN